MLEVENLTLEINSIGCPNCRPSYHAALKEYFSQYTDRLCPTCLERLDKNPLRIPGLQMPRVQREIAKGAPVVLDFLCDDCRTHFEGLKQRLAAGNPLYHRPPPSSAGWITTPRRCLSLSQPDRRPRHCLRRRVGMTAWWRVERTRHLRAGLCHRPGAAFGGDGSRGL